MNLYAYAGNNPVAFSDPWGLCPCLWLAFEVASTAYDAYRTVQAFRRSPADGADALHATLWGTIVPGPGTTYLQAGRKLDAAATWGRSEALLDHFTRHGSDFATKAPEEYAELASRFLQRAQREGLPTKVDGNGVIRVYDPRSNTFGAYNPDGTTRTFFKPESGQSYWDKQPGVAR